jgi:plastocyanin
MKKHIGILFPILVIMGMIYHSDTYAVKHIVHVGNFYFNPSSLNVSVGDTVRWQWDAGSHTTTSGVIPAGATNWDQNINSSSQNFEYPVQVAGLYNYVCTLHAAMGMIGTFTASGASPSLSVTPANQNVPSTSGITSFSVTSNSGWTATSNTTWCTVPSGGTGNGTINASYSINASFDQRVATISVSVAGLPVQNVTVTQAGAVRTLAVAPPSQNVAQNAGTTSFDVISNTTWTAVSNAGWCSATPSGSGNGTITATYVANSTTSVRIATISVSVTGLPVQIVTVVQAASTVGVGENTDLSVRIYPNPSRGLFKVTLGNTLEEATEISLLDISGRIINTGMVNGSGEMTFDLSESPNGYYFVRLKSGSGTSVRRIVIID